MERTQIEKAIRRINERIELAVMDFKHGYKEAEMKDSLMARAMVDMLREDFGINIVEDIRDFAGVENIIFWKLAD